MEVIVIKDSHSGVLNMTLCLEMGRNKHLGHKDSKNVPTAWHLKLRLCG